MIMCLLFVDGAGIEPASLRHALRNVSSRNTYRPKSPHILTGGGDNHY
ncbi:hypothetical protein K0F01_16390 [Parabacteroides distasonis]|nr:hypothetical protein [Parabacteroides distasonis]MCE8845831.1 hypothetical protein [Parabacteroides distasonis]